MSYINKEFDTFRFGLGQHLSLEVMDIATTKSFVEIILEVALNLTLSLVEENAYIRR